MNNNNNDYVSTIEEAERLLELIASAHAAKHAHVVMVKRMGSNEYDPIIMIRLPDEILKLYGGGISMMPVAIVKDPESLSKLYDTDHGAIVNKGGVATKIGVKEQVTEVKGNDIGDDIKFNFGRN